MAGDDEIRRRFVEWAERQQRLGWREWDSTEEFIQIFAPERGEIRPRKFPAGRGSTPFEKAVKEWMQAITETKRKPRS